MPVVRSKREATPREAATHHKSSMLPDRLQKGRAPPIRMIDGAG
ncbi:hypothetical protein PAMC26577_22805 [Caballeronia sordidicola]|uniref:Uncharacterized protein n=1 Tax=Caballeronia sordidicola TaxID=196367 RepID=A0A242MKT9_CABSO|nr:hypothetical protein PAMC26577_22805 [Caballeronia sordidicola]